MHFLHLELEENQELASEVYDLSRRTTENRAKIGLILDLNPFWLQAARLQDAGLDPEFLSEHFLEYYPFWRSSFPLDFLSDYGEQLPDLRYRFNFVRRITQKLCRRPMREEFQPFLFRIIARPNSEQIDREFLINIAREMRILTIVQSYDVPQFISAPGTQLVSGKVQGTLGGYLIDTKGGNTFAVTCGHVVSGGGMQISVHGSAKETVKHISQPVPLPSNQSCHMQCGSVTNLDIALITTNNLMINNVASSVAKIVGNGQMIEMTGATSGKCSYEIGGAVVEHEIGGSCWEKLIQFHAPLSGVLPVAARVGLTNLPQPGDSGAWMIQNNTIWAGMVVASNALFGFGLPASDLLKQANANFRTNLKLV